MSISAAFMVPHPPIILPEVGRGEEKKIGRTVSAYESVAEEIATIAPETIIISSPHATMYSDYFHISPGYGAGGNMSRFNASEVRFREEYDHELVEKISDLAEKHAGYAFPAGCAGEVESALDHGTMIPLYFIRKKYNDFKIIRIGLSGLSLSMHYEMGMIIKDAVEKIGRKAVYIASGDLSHKMKEDGPYGYVKEGPLYDEKIMKVCSEADFAELFNFDEIFLEKCAECGHRSFVMMAGAFDGIDVKAEALSHEATFGVGYGICRFLPGKNDENRRFLKKMQMEKLHKLSEKRKKESSYVSVARLSLESFISEGKKIKIEDLKNNRNLNLENEAFVKKAGAFVSIHKEGALRGCIGTIFPTCDCIAEEILQNAISAATSDPRFPAIRVDELPFLEINVDVMGKPEMIESEDELDVRRYGVIVTSGYKRGLLLPDLEGVDTVSQQIEIACRKAGINVNEKYSIERFEVKRYI